MRRTGTKGFTARSSSKAVRLSAALPGVGLLLVAGAAGAGDDDEGDKIFDEKIIDGGGHRVQAGAAAAGAYPAAAGLLDAVAELSLRHGPEGIPEQGIQSGCREVRRVIPAKQAG